ncbi:MAG TPA: MFS transporter [Devosia sp.]|nr:MFS transporter [Devosia sp.]
MTLATMPGQTNFIAQFNTALRAEFGLSHGEFGGYYTLATLASASVLVFVGVLADKLAARRLAIICMFGLAATALLMSGAGHVAILVVTLALLRFFGQGMLSHVAMTTMSRWFNRFRGRALSFAGLGYTIGDAILPFVLTVSILTFGWRNVWAGAAAVLVGIVVPAIWFLLRDPPEGRKGRPAVANPDGMTTLEPTGVQWTRARVLRDPLFYVLLPGIMAPPAIGTLYIFHQAHLTDVKGWDLTIFTAMFPFLSLSVAVSSIFAGFMVDRFGSWRLMPLVLLPLATASLILGTVQPIWSMPLVFVCIGLTQGMMNPVVGALWVELYGTAHIGAIRSLATAALVAASALGPGIAGYLIDTGAPLTVQTFGYAGYCIAGCLAYLGLQGAMARRVSALR